MDKHGTLEHRTIDTSNLKLLSRTDDFKVAKDSPDVRGWDVIGSDGKRVGKVEHLLIDPAARLVRYLGVDLDRSLAPGRTRGDRSGDHVLVPVDTARLSRDHRDRLYIPESSTQLSDLPVYDQDSIQKHLGSTEHHRARPEAHRTGQEAEQRITLSEEEVVVGKRAVQTGEATIGKRVETGHIRETVPVTREEVTVERRPATAAAGTEPRISQDEIRIPLMHEEVVVGKKVVPKEELVVTKHRTTGEERIDETVRKERAEVHGGESVKEVGKTNRRP